MPGLFVFLVLLLSACAQVQPPPSLKPAAVQSSPAQSPGAAKPVLVQSAAVHKSHSSSVAHHAKIKPYPAKPHDNKPAPSHAPAPAAAPGQADPVIEDAVLCRNRLGLYSYEKHLRDAQIIAGESKNGFSRLYVPTRPVSILGKPIGKLMLAGDDESDFAQFMVVVNAQADTLAALLRSKDIKLIKSKNGYRSLPQRQGVILINSQGKTATISCGHGLT